MTSQPVSEVWDIGYVPCSCGCGEEADVIMEGVPVNKHNPDEHLKTFMDKEIMHRGYQCDFLACPRYMHGHECRKPLFRLCKLYPADFEIDGIQVVPIHPMTMDDFSGRLEGDDYHG